jgi:hypothetical protein
MVWPLGILGGTFCCLYCLLWIHPDLAYRDVMMTGDDELDVLQIGFFWKIGFLNKTLEESVEADVLVLKTMAAKKCLSSFTFVLFFLLDDIQS